MQAGVYFAEACNRYRALGDAAALVDATGDGGYVAMLRGDLATAEAFLAESLALAVELHYGMRIGWALMSLGHVAAARGSAAQAVRLLAVAAAIWKDVGETMRPSAQRDYDRVLAEQRQRLGEVAFAEAWERGCGMSLKQAVIEGSPSAKPVDAEKG